MNSVLFRKPKRRIPMNLKKYLASILAMLTLILQAHQPLSAAKNKPVNEPKYVAQNVAGQKKLKKPVDKKERSHKSHPSQRCHTSPQCPKKFTLPQVVLANTSVQPMGSMVFNVTDEKIYFSNGMEWIAMEDELPLPATIIVDPALPSNGVTIFKTIQHAIDSLGDQNVEQTTISIAAGTYNENIDFQSILNSKSTKLSLVGDTRALAGVGIANNSFWNATATPAVPVGGGAGSVAVLSAISGTNTLTLTNSGSGIQPNFTAAGGVIPGDTVVLRADNGAFNSYIVQSVAPTQLTFTTNVLNTVGATPTTLGGAMCLVPNVTIKPTSGTVINQAAQVTLQGLTIEPSSAAVGIYANAQSVTRIKNVLINGGSIGINTSELTTTVSGSPRDISAGSFVYCDSSYGFTLFNQSVAGIVLLNTNLNPEGVLIAVPTSNPIAITESLGTIYVGQYGLRTIGNLQVVFSSKLTVGATFVDVMSLGGTGVSAQQGSVVAIVGQPTTGELLVRGVPTQGIFLGRSILQNSGVGRLSLLSTAATFTALQLSGGAGDGAWATVSFGNIAIPAGNGSTLVLAQDGSTIGFRGFIAGTTQTYGANSHGFQIFNGSTLKYGATNTTGNITGGGGTGTLFDIRGNSTLVMPTIPTGSRTFTGYNTIFNFDNNSVGNIFNVTATTANSGGFDVLAQNMSRVLVDTVTLSGTGTGIATASGAFVGQIGNATPITNSAGTAFSPAAAKLNTTSPITTAYSTGTIVYNP